MPELMLNRNLRRLELKNGIRADVWRIYEPQIAKMISKHKLKATNRRIFGVAKDIAPENMISIDHIIGIAGGRRVAHVHYKGDIYFLKSSQWREFSKTILKDMSQRLLDANQVNVTELLEVTDTVGALIR